jgi:uncharacterized membrane protein
VMNVAWFFNFQFSLFVFQVIGALGMGMLLLSLAIRLPFKIILISSIVLIAGHNLFDSFHVPGNGTGAMLWAWAWVHEFKGFQFDNFTLMLGYPIIPWTAIMMLGYCFGKLFESNFDARKRKSLLIYFGTAMIVGFVAIRLINGYGDPKSWRIYDSGIYTLLSFINVSKYPPSLLYTLITIGPALLFLAFAENMKSRWTHYVISLGRAPMLFYILHVYLIHILATIAAVASGFAVSDMVFNTWITDSPNLKGYGYGLPVVYLLWILVVCALLPICMKYDRYKSNHKEKWWLSYL